VPAPSRSRSLPVLDGPECCPAGLTAPLARDAAEDLAHLLKAVADPTRLQLLALIRASNRGEACVCDLTDPLDIAQPTVSHHLKVLTETGWVTSERRGSWIWYRIRPDAVSRLGRLLDQVTPGISVPAGSQVTGNRRLPVLDSDS